MIHDRLRRARVLKGLSLDELAQAVGDITKQALSKFERGDAIPNSIYPGAQVLLDFGSQITCRHGPQAVRAASITS